MTRNQYIELRNGNYLADIIFSFYSKACLENGVKPLPPQQFIAFYSMWEHNQQCTQQILRHYDEKLEVYELSHKGKVIRYF